jgi:hypothetical protein
MPRIDRRFSRRRVPRLTLLIAAAAVVSSMAGCGSDGSSATAVPLYSLSGTVSGLTASGLVLTNGNTTITASGDAKSFTFGDVLVPGYPYAVGVKTQPSGQTCSVANGTGTAGSANIANVVVTCSGNAFSLGGSISGLNGAGLVLGNGSDTVSVSANAGSFTLPTLVATGSSYTVQIKTQPAGEACAVSDGAGVMGSGAVTSVSVTCTDQPFTLGGSISGLSTSGLVLANGSDTLTVSANAAGFTLPTPVDYNSPYNMQVQSQPNGLTCSFSSGAGVAAGAGTMPAGNITNLALVCSPRSYPLGGTVSGLTSGTLVLQNGSETLNITANGSFQFSDVVAYGTNYAVTVQTQPTGLTCTVSNGSGTMTTSAVAVTVACSPSSYTLGGTIYGYTGSSLQLTDGVDTLTVATNAGTFSLPTPVVAGSNYAVTVAAQPSVQTPSMLCWVLNGAGTMPESTVNTVQVFCSTQSQSFTTVGGSYTFTVPSGVTSLGVIVTGGGGGASGGYTCWGSSGGSGATVTTGFTVNANDTETLFVGGGGVGGAGGGASGYGFAGGGGGGSSAINPGASNQVIAGGGGGSGMDCNYGNVTGNGGHGGTPAGGDSVDGYAQGGSGGTGGTDGATNPNDLAGGTPGGNGGGGAGGAGGADGDGDAGGGGGTGNGAGTGGAGSSGGCVGNGGGGCGGGGGGGGYGGGGGGGNGGNYNAGGGGGGGGSIGPVGSVYALAGNGGGATGVAGNPGGNGSIVIYSYSP